VLEAMEPTLDLAFCCQLIDELLDDMDIPACSAAAVFTSAGFEAVERRRYVIGLQSKRCGRFLRCSASDASNTETADEV
jgi:hypothetical protein